MMGDRCGDTQSLPNYHAHHQQYTFNRFRHLNNINVTATLNRQHQQQQQQLNQSSTANSNPVQIMNFIKLTEKNFPIRRNHSVCNDSGLVADTSSMRIVSNEFNPFADENESFARFQLSKSVSQDSLNPVQSLVQRTRSFGDDRTNFVQHSVPNSGKPAAFNLIESRVSASNLQAFKAMHVDDMSNSNDENTVMFRTYDLNDEYWLNFEWIIRYINRNTYMYIGPVNESTLNELLSCN